MEWEDDGDASRKKKGRLVLNVARLCCICWNYQVRCIRIIACCSNAVTTVVITTERLEGNSKDYLRGVEVKF